jgi:hypothetical protein
VRGLVPGFSYRLHFVWSLVDEQLGEFDAVFSTTDSSYLVRKLIESGQRGASTFDLIAYSRNLRMDVAVWELYPGLTAEDSLIGARHMDSAINHVKVICKDYASGERTRVLPRGATISAWRQQREQAHAEIMSDVAALAYQPKGNVGDIYPPDGREEAVGFEDVNLDGEKEDQWQHNFSAASEDVRISYSETVVALEMLNRYGLDEWARNSQKSSEDGHTVSDLIADLHIPAVVFNRHPDGRRESAESMMRAVGFRDITFQPTYDSATLDLAALEHSGRVSASWDYFTTTLLLYTSYYISVLILLHYSGRVSGSGDYVVKILGGWTDISAASKLRYIAHALDFQDVIERHAAAAATSPGAALYENFIAIFEDDIVLTSSPTRAHKRLVEVLSLLALLVQKYKY